MAATSDPEYQQGFCCAEPMKEHYQIEYSRFFNYPTPPHNNNISPNSPLPLRPLAKRRKLRHGGGTWLSSTAAAVSLHLLTDLTSLALPQTVLLISLRDTIQEEHFISKLHFSWPQVSCVSQCPVRGCRIVFASYKDCIGQIQKFAMRFSNSYESQTFINSLKECLKDVRNIGPPCCNLRSEVPFQTEIITSNWVHERADQELGLTNQTGSYTPLKQSSLYYQVEHRAFPEETTLPNENGGTCGDLPPSFTSLLADCRTEAEQDAIEPLKLLEDDFKFQIVNYMTTTSFNYMLSKVEKVIADLGGDLAL